MLFKLATGPIKLLLTLAINVTVWIYLYGYLSELPLILRTEYIVLPRSFLNDSLHYGLAINAIIFYINYLVLIDKYMSRSIARYLLISGCLVIGLSLIETALDTFLLHNSTKNNLVLSTMLFVLNISVHCIFWLVSTTLKTSVNWITQERLKSTLNAQRVDAELNLLKSQIHPHFLFNTLNTLYSSSYQSGDTDTANGIGKLSHLLRYMLYETSSDMVDLEKEVEYLENYIELQQMRFSNEVDLSFIIDGDINNYKIAPMLLITLVENAFKHGISPANKTYIRILLVINNQQGLIFSVENAKLSPRNNNPIDKKVGGMGLQNLRKRLAMLYPNRHNFITEIIDDKFVAKLELV